MTIRIVQLGSPRLPGEGVRLGTVRRPPRGVPRNRFGKDDWYDVWLPNLSPSQELVKAARSSDSQAAWTGFTKRFHAEMKRPDVSHLLDTLAALSHTADFSLGCYCDDSERCHRSILRELLTARQAKLA